MVVKLDISKAYNRVEWGFLRNIMIKLGLDHRWVNMAMETITTASYSVTINREPKGFISYSRGIKQGDPFSPYLFLLCAEGLLALLRKAEENRSLKGVLLANMGYVFHTFCFLMIVYYFAKQQLMNVVDCWNYLANMKVHLDKQLTDKRHPFSLAKIRGRRWEMKFNNYWVHESWRNVKSIWASQCQMGSRRWERSRSYTEGSQKG